MPKRKFKFGRLVRDRLVKKILDNGATPEFRKLGDDEFIYEMRRKILNKITQIEKKANNKEKLLTELASLYEIIINMTHAMGYNENDIKAKLELHQKQNGSYKDRIFVDYVECDKNYTYMKYFMENPDKYPEIVSLN